MRIHQIRQIDGVRYVALSDTDSESVRTNKPLIDYITPLGVVDVYRDGTREWGCAGPRYEEIPRYVRAALRRACCGVEA